jgi:hypothetical protein
MSKPLTKYELRIHDLINTLKKEETKFDMGDWGYDCGSACCIAGHAVTAAGGLQDCDICIQTAATEWLGLNHYVARNLFMAGAGDFFHPHGYFDVITKADAIEALYRLLDGKIPFSQTKVAELFERAQRAELGKWLTPSANCTR